MPSSRYRLFPRKLPSMLPTTILGKITAYIGSIWFLVHVARLTAVLIKPSNDALSGWASALNFIFGLFLLFMLFRWVRRVLLWRLRNRLIVTYVFIGVIPVLLILVMVGVAGYMISNQYATSQARIQMDSEIHAMRLAAETQARQLAESPDRHIFSPETKYLSERFPGFAEAAWRNGKQEAIAGQAADLQLPTW